MSSPLQTFRQWSTRVGHELVWLFIAGLFCIVEGVILITDIAPHLFRHNRGSGANAPDAHVRSESPPSEA